MTAAWEDIPNHVDARGIRTVRLDHVTVKNFRLLRDVDLSLEEGTTVIVGRNNTGKTSLAELFRRLLSDGSPGFRLEDFSLSTHEDFWTACVSFHQNEEEQKVREILPTIVLELQIAYDDQSPDLGVLAEFVIDVDPAKQHAHVVITHELGPGAVPALFLDIACSEPNLKEPQRRAFFRLMRERVPDLYVTSVAATVPGDPSSRKKIEWGTFRSLIRGDFINAQRGLDDVNNRDRDVLGKILEALFHTASVENADKRDQETAQKLQDAVKGIQDGIDKQFTKQLADLLPAFTLFGYPGLGDPGLGTETTLNVKRLLTDHTSISYAGINGINLPETYNGLGARNLIFILLKLLEFFKAFHADSKAPATHLIFIEEPEVHLHPQMQEVFIGQLNGLAAVLTKEFNKSERWSVQLIVTTHSSHVANRASFDSVRYFLAKPDLSGSGHRATIVKDLRDGLGGTQSKDREFLHKYMSLTRCDLFFADKAVLIEGVTERLLLPVMMEKLDESDKVSLGLSNQYISVMEVGGAYAHLFFTLLDFLELRTLIITDIDSIDPNDERRACRVSMGSQTSNACLTTLFGQGVSIDALLKATADEKLFSCRRVAFQIPESAGLACGRSFEDAFVLANLELFELDLLPSDTHEEKAWQRATEVKKKSEFAIEHAIAPESWSVPRYIADGLRWLRDADASPPAVTANTAVVTPAQK